ncbi:hypothetical protein EDD21DRAFT_393069 [Dissophora ornata]|nr:hypothetical protein EDD21DRAFT_393069 [Dissophora ornata]
MFVLSWIRSSDAQASNDAAAAAATNAADPAVATDAVAAAAAAAAVTSATAPSAMETEQNPDDWVFLPSDHTDLMASSVSDLDLLSASMTLYRPSTMTPSISAHPASSRTRADTTTIESTVVEAAAADSTAPAETQQRKSRRQLKQEKRQKQAEEELERRPRYDPMIAKMRDHEFKMAKMTKMGLRSGRVLAGGVKMVGGPQSSSAAVKTC